MVGPGRVGEINSRLGFAEFGEKEGTEVDCACARDGLERGCAAVGDGGAVRPQDEFLCGGGELGEAGNGEVFMVEVWVVADEGVGLRRWLVPKAAPEWWAVYLLDDRQDPRLCVVVSVGTNAQVYLFGVRVSSVGCHETEQGIFRSLRAGIGLEPR